MKFLGEIMLSRAYMRLESKSNQNNSMIIIKLPKIEEILAQQKVEKQKRYEYYCQQNDIPYTPAQISSVTL